MNAILKIPLSGTPEQIAKLHALQAAFADVCNAIAPVVQSTRCWNRVALHHLVYRTMRERFPALGSQMICNAVYAVSRTARLVLQHPGSPFRIARQAPNAPLPLLHFAPTAPVYFDRHTLSVKGNVLSMFTLDGRIPFVLQLQAADITRFHDEKLILTVLSGNNDGFRLTFQFAAPAAAEPDASPIAPATTDVRSAESEIRLPAYLAVISPEPVEVGDITTPRATSQAAAGDIALPESESPAVAMGHP